MNRPEFDAVAHLARKVARDITITPSHTAQRNLRCQLDGLRAALHATAQLRYTVQHARHTAGWTVEDRWTGDSLDYFTNHTAALVYAGQHNQANADDAVTEALTQVTA